MNALCKKGLELSGFMIELLEIEFGENVNIITPKNSASRGCQGKL